MSFKKINQILVVLTLLFLSLANVVQAGFGISPPYVQNSNLTRNSYYEQKIYLGRSDPSEAVKVEVKIDVPGANDWISIDRGNSFVIPKGEKQVPMIVRVKVPDDAEFGNYKGTIRVRVIPIGSSKKGQVSIVLGAQIDVDLDVLDKTIYDFKVWKVNIPNLEEGHKIWIFFFPGRLRFETEIENLGNIKAAPTKILLNIYDSKRQNLLETLETTKIEKIDPFSTKKIAVEFPTRLLAGSYEAEFRIFKGNEIAKQGMLHVSVLPYGTIPGYKGYGFEGLSLRDKAIIISMGIGIVIVLICIIWKIVRFLKKRRKRR